MGYLCLNTDNVITEIGSLDRESESTEFYDGILCPGFVNSHCHIELSHLKDKFTRNSGMAGFIRQINSLRESSDRSERLRVIGREMDKLYDSGVSAMADISNCDDSFSVKSSSPLYTRTFLEVFGTESEEAESIVKNVKTLQDLSRSYNIDAGITPHSPYTMSTRLLSESAKEALKVGWLSYHNQESWEEDELIRYGKGPLADEYKSRGLSTPPVTGNSPLKYFLSVLDSVRKRGDSKIKENILLVHNTFSDEESVDAAMEMIENLFWAICPLSNLFIHSSLPPVELLRRKGSKITIGTDSLSSNSILSMTEEMKTLQRYFPYIALDQMLKWACYNGAAFLKKEKELGSFEVGKKPGVVLISNVDYSQMKLTNESNSRRIV